MSEAGKSAVAAAVDIGATVPRGDERRRTARVPTDALNVRLEVGPHSLAGRVRDVSRGGLGIALDVPSGVVGAVGREGAPAEPPVAVGARVTVHHHALGDPLQGLCVRRAPGEIGIAFDSTVGEVERTLQCLALVLADGG